MAEAVGFIHSKCCNAHWELVLIKNGNYELICEKCGTSAGTHIMVFINPDVVACGCFKCKNPLKPLAIRIPGKYLDCQGPQGNIGKASTET